MRTLVFLLTAVLLLSPFGADAQDNLETVAKALGATGLKSIEFQGGGIAPDDRLGLRWAVAALGHGDGGHGELGVEGTGDVGLVLRQVLAYGVQHAAYFSDHKVVGTVVLPTTAELEAATVVGRMHFGTPESVSMMRCITKRCRSAMGKIGSCG